MFYLFIILPVLLFACGLIAAAGRRPVAALAAFGSACTGLANAFTFPAEHRSIPAAIVLVSCGGAFVLATIVVAFTRPKAVPNADA